MQKKNQEQDDLRRKLTELSDLFAVHEGRRPRLMIASLGQGQKAEIIKTSNEFADLGFDVDIAPAPDGVQLLMQQVTDNDVHILLLLVNQADLKEYLDDILSVIKDQQREVLFVVKSEDPIDKGAFEHLNGLVALFGPGSKACDLAAYMFDVILGHA